MNRHRLRDRPAGISRELIQPAFADPDGLFKDGTLSRLRRTDGAPLDAWCYRPRESTSTPLTLVSVHGVSRNAKEHLLAWRPYADRCGFQLVVPEFPTRTFRGYQQLEFGSGGESPDALLAELMSRLPGLTGFRSVQACLFGFSGGAQFVHRLLLTQPGVAQAAVLVAPGWWTLPEGSLPFPIGCGAVPQRPGLRLDVRYWLGLPILVTVGDGDTERDANLRQDVFTDERQGRTRRERAERWVRELGEIAKRETVPSLARFQLIAGAGHDFLACMQAGLGDGTLKFLRDSGCFPLLA